MSYVGVNIGALTVKIVAVQSGNKIDARVMAHQGRPLEVLAELTALPEFARVVVTGDFFARFSPFFIKESAISTRRGESFSSLWT